MQPTYLRKIDVTRTMRTRSMTVTTTETAAKTTFASCTTSDTSQTDSDHDGHCPRTIFKYDQQAQAKKYLARERFHKFFEGTTASAKPATPTTAALTTPSTPSTPSTSTPIKWSPQPIMGHQNPHTPTDEWAAAAPYDRADYHTSTHTDQQQQK